MAVPVDRKRVRELLDLLKASDAAEVAVQEGDRYYRLTRMTAVPEAAVHAGPAGAPALTEADAGPELVTVTARVVGLFYRGDEPGGEPLVEVGALVREGEALGIIEVLRKPTEIVSPANGEVAEIFHQDGDGVQYGDALFAIRPA